MSTTQIKVFWSKYEPGETMLEGYHDFEIEMNEFLSTLNRLDVLDVSIGLVQTGERRLMRMCGWVTYRKD